MEGKPKKQIFSLARVVKKKGGTARGRKGERKCVCARLGPHLWNEKIVNA